MKINNSIQPIRARLLSPHHPVSTTTFYSVTFHLPQPRSLWNPVLFSVILLCAGIKRFPLPVFTAVSRCLLSYLSLNPFIQPTLLLSSALNNLYCFGFVSTCTPNNRNSLVSVFISILIYGVWGMKYIINVKLKGATF